MGTAITALFSFFIVFGTTMTVINTVLQTGSDNAEAQVTSNQRLIDDIETSVKLVSASATTGAGVTQVDVVVTNDGRRTLDSFAEWAVHLPDTSMMGSSRALCFARFRSSESVG